MPTQNPYERRPITVKQLCAIARRVIECRPALDNFEWQEAIKDLLLRQGWGYPADSAAIHLAMSQVDYALQKQGLVRPLTVLSGSLPPLIEKPDSALRFPRQLTAPLSWRSLMDIATSLLDSHSFNVGSVNWFSGVASGDPAPEIKRQRCFGRPPP